MASDGSTSRVVLVVAAIALVAVCGGGALLGIGVWFLHRASEERAAAAHDRASAAQEGARRKEEWLRSLPVEHRAAISLFDEAEDTAREVVDRMLGGEEGPDAAVARTLRERQERDGPLRETTSPGARTTEDSPGAVRAVTVELELTWTRGEPTLVQVVLARAPDGALTASRISLPGAAPSSR